MLTDRKRKKLLAGVLAAVMLTSTAGCGTEDKDSDWQNDNTSQEEKKDGNGGFFSGFFPWYFIGRTFGVGPMAGVRQAAPASAQQQQNEQQTAAGGAGAAAGKSSTGDGKSTGSTVQQGSTSAAQKSTLGSTGSSGKSGIGSGLSRSSGSAIS